MLIYLVTNTVNGKIYIGKWHGKSVKQRWAIHLAHARSFATGKKHHFHSAIRKYGPDAFVVSVIDRATDPKQLAELEKFYIAKFRSHLSSVGYNMTMGGEGEAWTEERRIRESAERRAMKRKNSPEAIEKMRLAKLGEKNPFFNKTHTPENRRKMGDANRDKPKSSATRAKMATAKMGNTNGAGMWLGRSHTNASRRKMTRTRLEMYAADPSMAVKVSEEMKRNWEDPETKAKMLAGLEKARANSPVLKKGRHLSAETKRRIGEAQKRRLAERKHIIPPCLPMRNCKQAGIGTAVNWEAVTGRA